MSGVELVLAIIPIAADAIGIVHSTLDAGRRFRKWHLQLQEYVQQLRQQEMQLGLTIKLMLMNVITHSGIIMSMVKDCAHPNWRDQQLQAALRRTYEDDYTTIENLVNDIFAKLKLLMFKLKLIPDLSMTQEQLRRLLLLMPKDIDLRRNQLRNRVAFSMKYGETEPLFAQLQSQQVRLQNIVSTHREVQKALKAGSTNEETCQTEPAHAVSAVVKPHREHLGALHQCLTGLVGCKHPCHQVGVKLQHPDGALQRFEFGLLFCQQPYWESGQLSVSKYSNGEKCMSASCYSGKQRAVPHDLCPFPENIGRRKDAISLHLRLPGPQIAHGEYHQTPGSTIDMEPPETLATLLATVEQLPDGRQARQLHDKMTRRARMAIAARLSFFIQCAHKTRWLPSSWDGRDIQLRPKDNLRKDRYFEPGAEFFVRKFDAPDPVSSRHMGISSNLASAQRQCHMLMLGLMLMELWFGETHRPHRMNGQEAGVLLNEWLNQKGGELSMPFKSVVASCMSLDMVGEDETTKGLEKLVNVVIKTEKAW